MFSFLDNLYLYSETPYALHIALHCAFALFTQFTARGIGGCAHQLFWCQVTLGPYLLCVPGQRVSKLQQQQQRYYLTSNNNSTTNMLVYELNLVVKKYMFVLSRVIRISDCFPFSKKAVA